MARLMSVALTADAVIARRKTVTRRLGWWQNVRGNRIVVPGESLTLCRKVMGRWHRDPQTGLVVKEPLERLAEVRVVSVSRERLWDITDSEILAEGVPDHGQWAEVYTEHDDPRMVGQPSPAAWVAWFCEAMGCEPHDLVTRIEWRYLDEPEVTA